jgi:hypothetical protein
MRAAPFGQVRRSLLQFRSEFYSSLRGRAVCGEFTLTPLRDGPGLYAAWLSTGAASDFPGERAFVVPVN